jgi:hypothetical protein
MTGIDRRDDTPMGPPWPVDVLADLHAGVLDTAVSDELWPKVRSDPQAQAVLDSLDATQAELTGLATRPPPPMPAHFAARLDAAIAAEAAAMFAAPAPRQPLPVAHQPAPPVAPVIDLAAARGRRNRRMGWGAGVLVAAAAVAVVVIAIPHGSTTPGGAIAEPPPSIGAGSTGGGSPVALRGDQLTATTAASALGRSDYGPLADPTRRAACLAANGVDANRTPAGAMRVTLDGKPGILMVLTTGKLAQYRLLVVGSDCAAGHPDTLANTVIGGTSTTPTR